MTAFNSVPAAASAEAYLEQSHPDVLRAMVKMFAEQLMSAEADAACGAEYGHRPLDQSPYTFIWADALVMKVREGGRVVNVHVLVAVGVNADGHREVLGIDVASGEDGAGWLAFFRGLVARG